MDACWRALSKETKMTRYLGMTTLADYLKLWGIYRAVTTMYPV